MHMQSSLGCLFACGYSTHGTSGKQSSCVLASRMTTAGCSAWPSSAHSIASTWETCLGPIARNSRDLGGHLKVEEGQRRIQNDLQNGVDCHEDGAVFRAASRQLVPQQHHRDAAREADQDDAGPVAGQVGQRGPRERHLRMPGTLVMPGRCT